MIVEADKNGPGAIGGKDISLTMTMLVCRICLPSLRASGQGSSTSAPEDLGRKKECTSPAILAAVVKKKKLTSA